MKKAIWIIALFIGFNLTNLQAQDKEQNEKDVTVNADDDDMNVDVDSQSDANVEANVSTGKERSRFGNFLHKSGSAVGSAAKWTGKEIGNASSWTWDNTKHNKVTKEVFDQPGDNDPHDLSPVKADVEE
jgi:hypothetical protein